MELKVLQRVWYNLIRVLYDSLKTINLNISKYENVMHEYPYDSELMNGKYLESITKLVSKNRTNFKYKDMKSNKFLFKLSNLLKL